MAHLYIGTTTNSYYFAVATDTADYLAVDDTGEVLINGLWIDTSGNLATSTSITSAGAIIGSNITAASSTAWDLTADTFNASSSNWEDTYLTVTASSSNWSDTYFMVNASSSNWDTAYVGWNASNTNWDWAADYLIASSSKIDTSYDHSQDNTQAHSDYLLNTGDTASGDYTFDTDTLFIDAGNNRIGIGTTSPNYGLEVMASTTNGYFGISGSTQGDVFLVAADGNVYINDSTNTQQTLGLTINQGANDDSTIVLKSSDVAHGLTGYFETDTYGDMRKWDATSGGLMVQGFKDADGTAGGALVLRGMMGEDVDTTKSTGGIGAVRIHGWAKSGTAPSYLNAGANILSIEDAGSVTAWIVDNEGDTWQNGGAIFGDNVYINDSTNTKSTLGLTINMGANDNDILTFKSSDVVHGMTDFAEADTWATFEKDYDEQGGLAINGYVNAATPGVMIRGRSATAPTGKTTASTAIVKLSAQIQSGSSVGNVGADGNLVMISNTNDVKWLIDAEGDVFQTGNLGIGTTSPAYGLELMSSTTAGFFGVSANTQGDMFSIDTSGNVVAAGTITGSNIDAASSTKWSVASDKTLLDEIEFTIANPTTTAGQNFWLLSALDYAATVTEVFAMVDPAEGEEFTFDLYEGNASGSATSTLSAMSADEYGISTTTFTDAQLDANDILSIQMIAASGTPDQLKVRIKLDLD